MRTLAIILGFTLPSGCTAKIEPASLSRVVIDAPREFDAAAEDRDSVRKRVTELLRADEDVEFDLEEREPTHVLKIRIGPLLAREPDKEDSEKVRPVEVVLRPSREAPHFETVGKGTDVPDRVESVMAGFVDAWAVLSRCRRLQRQDDEDVVAALTDVDPRVRDFAIQRLGERRSAAAMEPLIAALTDEERPDLQLRAIGSLIAIGDERAVGPLIDLTKRKDPAFVSQVIFAVGAIGGRTAEAFLVTLAGGHPSEYVQKSAKDALDEMTEKRARAAQRP